MRIAVISFDQEFAKKIKDSLGDEHQVRIYIDSLGMLRDLKEFKPDIIIYDASAGEFAIDDLKFLMTRDKLGDIKFEIFISRAEPINVDELPKKIAKDVYYKEDDDINKLIVKLKSSGLIEEDLGQDLLLGGEETGESLLQSETESPKKEKEADLDSLLSQSPEDIEDLLMGGFEEEKPKEEKPKAKPKKEEEVSKPPSDEIFNEDIPLDELESILGNFSLGEEKKEEKKPEPKKVVKEEQKKEKEELAFNPEDIEDLLGLSGTEEKEEDKTEILQTPAAPPKAEKKKVKKEDFLADIEDLLGTPKPKKEEIKKEEKEEKEEEKIFKTEDIEDLLSDIGVYQEEKKAPKKEEKIEMEEFEVPEIEEKPKKTPPKKAPILEKEPVLEEISPKLEAVEPTVISKGGNIKLEINISEEEIKRLIVKETVNKMVEELKNDKVLKELIENIQKDFIDRTERELEGLKEVVKVEVKTKLLKKIEDDLKEKVKESIKKDVMEITTKLVKQKLEQIFGK